MKAFLKMLWSEFKAIVKVSIIGFTIIFAAHGCLAFNDIETYREIVLCPSDVEVKREQVD